MEAIISLLIFACFVALAALIINYVVQRILAALSLPNGDIVKLIIGLIALLIILHRAWPVINAYT